MNLRRWFSLMPALLPAAAVFVWAALAHAWPEPWLLRVRAGEAVWSPTWLGCMEFAGEPMHLGMRFLHRLALALPGATFATVAWLSAAFAFTTVCVLAAMGRRSFAMSTMSHRLALVLVGLLVAVPAHGAIWLAGERIGAVLTPLLFVLAVHFLHGEGRFRWRAAAALLLAVVAPFCHSHGVVVAFALVPVLRAAVARAGSTRTAAWLVTAVLLGNLAAALSLRTATDVVAAAPGYATLVTFVMRVGAAIGDVLPGARADDAALGASVLALLLVLPRLGDRSGIARERASVWWSCVWFALGLLAFDALRFGDHPTSGTWREATYGAFLLPIGVVGVLACRFGAGVLRIAAGALLVLAVQDWHRGLEELRLARVRGELAAAAMALPIEQFGLESSPLLRDPSHAAVARARGWAQTKVDFTGLAIAPGAGAECSLVTAGEPTAVRGTVRSTLHQPGVATVFVVDAAQPTKVLGAAWPDFAAARNDRVVPWTVALATPLAEGARILVLGFRPGLRSSERLTAVHVLQNGRLVAEAPR